MIRISSLPLLALIWVIFLSCEATVDEATIKQEILDHGQTIRDAFSSEDIATITALHHPDVIKALAYTDLKQGREEVIEGITNTLKHYSLDFVANKVEHILIQPDLAIEQTTFVIKGTPKAGGDSFLFKGRTMVTYVRYAESPSGWATIREIIQPATE